MDSITRTAQSAVINYYNVLRRMGNVNRQDKYRLVVLWLFHYLKNRSDFLYVPEFYKDDDGKQHLKGWKIDRVLEAQLERKFRCNVPCLEDSCFVSLLGSDECTPVIEKLWDDAEEEVFYRLLVTNATAALMQIAEETGKSIEDILDNYMWTNGSGLLVPNENQKELNEDGVELLGTNNQKLQE